MNDSIETKVFQNKIFAGRVKARACLQMSVFEGKKRKQINRTVFLSRAAIMIRMRKGQREEEEEEEEHDH